MQDVIKLTPNIILNTLSDIEHARRLLKAGLQKQALTKLTAIEASLHTSLGVEEIEPKLPYSHGLEVIPHIKQA